MSWSQADLIPIELLESHLHLSSMHQEALFGSRSLHVRSVRQGLQGQCVYEEMVRVAGPHGFVEVPVYGPCWEHTQLEIMPAQVHLLGLEPPVADSGEHVQTEGTTIQGPVGSAVLKEGVIIPRAHLHCSPAEATRFGVRHGGTISLCLAEDPRITFTNISVRVHPTYRLLFHLVPGDASVPTFKKGLMAQRLAL